MEYRYNPLNTIWVSFQTLNKNNFIQKQMNNQGFNAEQIKRIYIRRVKLFEDYSKIMSKHSKIVRN
jgi:hypothetical protein